jgi:hypothetical protein
VIDGFSWKVNKHDVKFGFEFHRTSVQQYFDKYFRGRLEFASLANFLAGTVNTGFGKSIEYSGDTVRHTFENGVGLYVQDSFHVTPRLMVNYGLRWDYFGVVSEKKNLFSNFDTATDSLVQVGSNGLSELYRPDHKNFGPRLSVAWDVFGDGKTVVRSGFGIFYDAFSQDFFLGHLPYPPFFDPGPAYNNIGPAPILPAAANGTIVSGAPAYGPPSCATVECDIFAFDRNIKTPYMENFNLNIQRQIASKVVLQLGYVGSQGHRLFRFFDINQPSAAAITSCDLGTSAACAGAPAIHDFSGLARPFGSPAGSFYILQENSSGKSNYNALQTSLRISAWHGVTSIVNYVWSRSMDNSSDGEDFVPNAAQPQDSTNTGNEYGPSNFNVPNRFTWIFGYELPKMTGGWERLKNGWGVDSTVTLQSGQPFNFNYNAESDFSGSGEGFDRPDVVGPIVYHRNDPNNYINLTAFAVPCQITPGLTSATAKGTDADCVPGTRHFGNLGRDALVGGTFKQWDLAFYKNTPINERVDVQFRAEFFNILNHPNFANPLLPAFIADPAINGLQVNGGHEVGKGGYPITATGDVGIGNPFLGGGGPRGIQLALKFTF